MAKTNTPKDPDAPTLPQDNVGLPPTTSASDPAVTNAPDTRPVADTRPPRTAAEAQGVAEPADPVYPMPSGGAFGTATVPQTKTYPRMKVRAIKDGYYDDKLRRIGDVFEIDGAPLQDVIEREVNSLSLAPGAPVAAAPDRASLTKRDQMILDAHDKRTSGVDERGQTMPAAFSAKWMQPVDANTPERITTPQQVINREHDETLAARGATTAVAPPIQPTGNTSVIE